MDEAAPQLAVSSPDGRFGRYSVVLGQGSVKTVYKALDRNHGKQVAWNEVDLALIPVDQHASVRLEVEVLTRVSHPHVIEFHGSWAQDTKLVFITEVVESGDLQHFYATHSVKLKVIKKLARQVLDALHYLHSFSPPLVHRDIKCQNVLYNAAEGSVKLGDLGLSCVAPSLVGGSGSGSGGGGGVGGEAEAVAVGATTTPAGTPAYMAPEMYEGVVNSGCDVYAFGMVVLEMVTRSPPYSECTNLAQVFLKVHQGKPPAALARILPRFHSLHDFISYCIAPLEPGAARPSAHALLQHPFLCQADEANDEETLFFEVDEEEEEEEDIRATRSRASSLGAFSGTNGGGTSASGGAGQAAAGGGGGGAGVAAAAELPYASSEGGSQHSFSTTSSVGHSGGVGGSTSAAAASDALPHSADEDAGGWEKPSGDAGAASGDSVALGGGRGGGILDYPLLHHLLPPKTDER